MFQLLFHFIYFYQGNLAYCIYILFVYIVNGFKYLFLLSENKGSYLYYYYIGVVRF